MNDTIRPIILLLSLLNPFILSIYLMEIIRGLGLADFSRVLFRALLISWIVFSLFAWFGERVFTDFLQVSTASFLMFGGTLFAIIGVQLAFQGAHSIKMLRGSAEHVGGAIAMPFMIGPGTVSASILIGTRFSPLVSSTAILATLIITVLFLVGFKVVHDRLMVRNALLVARYVDVVGRLSALLIGTIAVEMFMRGLRSWMSGIPPY